MNSYPHAEVRLFDNTIYRPPYAPDQLGLFRPFILMPSRKGESGKIKYYRDYRAAVDGLGRETFDPNSEYFSTEALYARTILGVDHPSNKTPGIFIGRLTPVDATKANMVLEVAVEPADDVPVYATDDMGRVILDSNGDPTPATGSPVVSGYKLTWSARHLDAGTDITTLGTREIIDTEDNNALKATVYPIMAFEANAAGQFGNDTSVALWFDYAVSSRGIVDSIASAAYSMQISEKDAVTNRRTAIMTKMGDRYISFSLNENALDLETGIDYNLDAMIEKYGDAFPFTTHVYRDNIYTIGNLILNAESSILTNNGSALPDNANPWTINLFNGTYYTDELNYLNSVQIITDPSYYLVALDSNEMIVTTMSNLVSHSLDNGTDGTVGGRSGIESMINSYLQQDITNDNADLIDDTIMDKGKYPFNYMFDVGYTFNTKHVLINFMSERDDLRVSFSPQVIDEDTTLDNRLTITDEQTAASNLLLSLLANPENYITGVGACRGSIWYESGVPVGYDSKWIVPLTLWDAWAHTKFMSDAALGDRPEGLPNSVCDIFKLNTINWIPSTEYAKKYLWDTNGNYLEYARMNEVHYAATRSIYEEETSSLINNTFVDVCVALKQVSRFYWHKYSNMSVPFKVLSSMVKEDLGRELGIMLNGQYITEVDVYQTDEERKLGYIGHVVIRITAPNVTRVWIIDIDCRREGLEG